MKKRKINFTKKYFTSEGNENRKAGLRAVDWTAFFAENDPTILYDKLIEIYSHHYNSNLTVKQCQGRWNIVPWEPWMTQDLNRDIKYNYKIKY